MATAYIELEIKSSKDKNVLKTLIKESIERSNLARQTHIIYKSISIYT